MSVNIEKMPAETLTQSLIQGTVDVNALNLAKVAHREAFSQAVKSRPNLLTKVKDANAKHFLSFALNENPEYFIYLKQEQYTNELAQKYLEKRLAPKNDGDTSGKSVKLSMQKSLDDKLVFVYTYATPEGRALYYYDHELQVPSSLRYTLKVSLKLEDALDLIRELDTNVAQLGEKKVKALFTDIIVSGFKAYFNEYLMKHKVGYYTLCASCRELEEGFKNELDKAFKKYGIEVRQFAIKQLAIPKDIQNKIEDLAFQIRQQRANIEADAEFAKKSLEHYEAKLAIQQKYPDTAHTLTEYEKDLALKRYLVKTGRLSEEEIDRSIKLAQTVEATDKALNKEEDIVPDIPMKKNGFRSKFIGLLSVALIASVSLFAAGAGAGLIALGVTTAIFGTVAAFNHEKFKDQPMEIAKEETENVGTNL